MIWRLLSMTSFQFRNGHALIISKRLIATWFDASDAEQAGMMSLVGEVRRFLDELLNRKPDGYNVGFNSGIAAGPDRSAPAHTCDPLLPRGT
jgi:diadenosine tetraphosphate (Ap4A) HIT family hydrolase